MFDFARAVTPFNMTVPSGGINNNNNNADPRTYSGQHRITVRTEDIGRQIEGSGIQR